MAQTFTLPPPMPDSLLRPRARSQSSRDLTAVGPGAHSNGPSRSILWDPTLPPVGVPTSDPSLRLGLPPQPRLLLAGSLLWACRLSGTPVQYLPSAGQTGTHPALPTGLTTSTSPFPQLKARCEELRLDWSTLSLESLLKEKQALRSQISEKQRHCLELQVGAGGVGAPLGFDAALGTWEVPPPPPCQLPKPSCSPGQDIGGGAAVTAALTACPHPQGQRWAWHLRGPTCSRSVLVSIQNVGFPRCLYRVGSEAAPGRAVLSPGTGAEPRAVMCAPGSVGTQGGKEEGADRSAFPHVPRPLADRVTALPQQDVRRGHRWALKALFARLCLLSGWPPSLASRLPWSPPGQRALGSGRSFVIK